MSETLGFDSFFDPIIFPPETYLNVKHNAYVEYLI